MFRGSFEHTLDNKGRLSIPSKFRDVLVGKGDERIVMTNYVIDSQRCLDVYPMDAWLQFEDEVRKKPKFDPRMVRFLVWKPYFKIQPFEWFFRRIHAMAFISPRTGKLSCCDKFPPGGARCREIPAG